MDKRTRLQETNKRFIIEKIFGLDTIYLYCIKYIKYFNIQY